TRAGPPVRGAGSSAIQRFAGDRAVGGIGALRGSRVEGERCRTRRQAEHDLRAADRDPLGEPDPATPGATRQGHFREEWTEGELAAQPARRHDLLTDLAAE